MLRAALGFEHNPRNVVDTWLASAGWTISRHPTYPTYGKGLIIDNDGWLTVPEGMSPGTDSFVFMDLRPFMDTSGKANMICVGYRAKLVKAGVAGAGNLCLWAAHGSSRATHSVASFANLFPAGSPEGTECLVEFVLDLKSTYRYTFVNGVLLGYTIYTGLTTNLLQTGDFGLFLSPSVANTPAVVAYRDFWITDDIPGDGMTGRLGDMKVRPITLSVASGAGWSASDGGTLLDALNQPYDKVNPAVIDSAVGAGPLSLQFANNLPTDQAVQAVQFFLNAKGSTNTAETQISMERNGAVTVSRKVALDVTQKLRPVRAWPLAPDGTRWTAGKLASTTIKITPE